MVEQLNGQSQVPDLTLLEQLQAACPAVFSEGRVDLDKLREALGEAVDGRPDRYGLSWAGKADCFRHIQEPTTATLIPDREQSVDFDRTENLFIEGDNLQVLKVLQKSYYGKVKMIYIDPPYNTGNDSFIYPDRFSESKEDYLQRIGDKDVEGNLMKDGFFRKNSKDAGHYHSNWLNMIYPRLFLARNLLRDDGVIFVSIDDNEVHNLRMVMNEIFGEENFLAQLTWEKTRKNDAKMFSVGHEYILVFSRNLQHLRDIKTVWREQKPGAKEIIGFYQNLKEEFSDDYESMENSLQEWYKGLPKTHPSKKLSRYKHIDKWGPWRDRDISWPGGGGPRYDVIHPKTGKPCHVPEQGWRFSSPKEMQRQIAIGLVVYREDHTKPPFRKAYLLSVPEELSDEAEEIFEEINEEEEVLVGLQVMPTVIYKQAQVAIKYLRKLMGAKIFDNPKDHVVLKRLIRYVTSPDDIILDFFSGASSTAHAVMELNNEENHDRKYVCVQLAEACDEGSEAAKAGFGTIADIGRERIRRAGVKIREENEGKLDFEGGRLDLGFKAFVLSPSNFKEWASDVDSPEQLEKQMEFNLDPIKPDAQRENILYELLLKSGLDLNVPVQQITLGGHEVYSVNDGQLLICLDEQVDQNLTDELVKKKPEKVIMAERAFANNDPLKTNTALQMEQADIDLKVV